MAEKKLNLLADFPAVSTEEWMAKIEADLKGADFNKKLVWRTNEGFNVMPFYRAENLEGIKTTDSRLCAASRLTMCGWFVRTSMQKMPRQPMPRRAMF